MAGTWLADHKDEEINVSGYTIFRSDRSRKKARRGRWSGGVALYARDDIAARMEIILKFSNGVNEAIVIYSEKENLIVVIVYRQPDDSRNGHPSRSVEFKKLLTSIRTQLLSLPGRHPDILICGDFNLPHVEWPSAVIRGSSTKDEKQMLDDLKEFMSEFFLQQIITDPTHKDGNVLDLLLTNNSSMIHSYQCTPTINEISYHSTIEVAIKFDTAINVGAASSEVRDTLDNFNYFDEKIEWTEVNGILGKLDWVMEFRDVDPNQKTVEVS